MSVATTQTVTINAAFLQEIKQDNVELRDLLERSSSQLSVGSHLGSNPRTMVDTLSRLRDQLAMHFALEEAFGYFDDAVDVAPRLSARAEDLRQEHEQFFLEMCEIVERAERLLYREASPQKTRAEIAQRFSAFYSALNEHEAREQDLILEALDEDIGVGD